MNERENNGLLSNIFNSKEQKSSKFASPSFHNNFSVLYKEIDFNSLIEESCDKKNENDNEKYSWKKDYYSFLEEENESASTQLD